MLNRKKIEAITIASRTNDINKLRIMTCHIDTIEEASLFASIVGGQKNHDSFTWLIQLMESALCEHTLSHKYVERFNFANGELVYESQKDLFTYYLRGSDVKYLELKIKEGIIQFYYTAYQRISDSRLFRINNIDTSMSHVSVPHRHFDIVKFFETR